MKTIALAFRYLWSRPLAALLNLLLLTLGLASITFVLLASEQVDRVFQRDLAGIDVVIGAKGSPMQLILSGVFHIDVAPGNIPLAEVEKLRRHPHVAKLIPLSLGDSYQGFRIVGTTPDYQAHYGVAFARGAGWAQPMEAVLGAQAPRETGLDIGAAFAGSHGLAGGGGDHAAAPYRVTGVLAPCGCVIDRLVLTASESVWAVHDKHEKSEKGGKGEKNEKDGKDSKAADVTHSTHEEPDDREVTIALISYRTPLAAASFPRLVNSSTAMQAAAPAIEVSRLLRMLGVGSQVLRGMGVVLLVTAVLSVFIALWNAVRERRADLAMLRMLGASPARIAALLLCEAWWLAVIAAVLGLAAGHLLAELAGSLLEAQRSLPMTGRMWVPTEAWIPATALGVATLAALIPAFSAYRVDVTQLLGDR